MTILPYVEFIFLISKHEYHIRVKRYDLETKIFSTSFTNSDGSLIVNFHEMDAFYVVFETLVRKSPIVIFFLNNNFFFFD